MTSLHTSSWFSIGPVILILTGNIHANRYIYWNKYLFFSGFCTTIINVHHTLRQFFIYSFCAKHAMWTWIGKRLYVFGCLLILETVLGVGIYVSIFQTRRCRDLMPLLLTWFKFNLSIDILSYVQWSVGWNYLTTVWYIMLSHTW